MTNVLRNPCEKGIPGQQPPGANAVQGRAAGVLFAVAVILGPALLLWHLHALWNPNGAYAYGWIVPLLAAFLFISRWEDRPSASLPAGSAAFFAIVCALLILPAHWLQEAAPERGICAWTYAVASIGISLTLIARAGGWAWFRWFAFPFAFILTAVPWPHSMELHVSNSLMGATAGTTVEILCLGGIPSAQAGNLVHIETGVIDIDEACSGIRSLQAMVMISLFLGELFRLKPGKRLLLMAIGIAITLVTNVLRTVTLSSLGFSKGMSAVDHYHDTAGLVVLLLSLAVTAFAAFKLRPAKTPALPAPATPQTSAPDITQTTPAIAPVFPLKLSALLFVWFLVAEISVEAWYRIREPKWQGWSWSVQWPRHADGFRFIDIPERSLRLLMCDKSQAATWKEPDGSEWSLYSIRWNPGNPAAESAKVHRPDVCLNAEGAIMEKDLGTRLIPVGGLQLPFHSYTFRMGEKTLHVFFCIWEEIPGNPATAATPQFEGVDMFQRALAGRRHIGEQSLEFAVSGYRSEASAQQAFKAHLAQLMQVR